MSSHLGQYVLRQREKLGIGRGQLAGMLGYRNLGKGSKRIMDLEQHGACTEKFWHKIEEALHLEGEEVAKAVHQDWLDYQSWLDEPVPMELVIRYMPAVYGTVDLSADVAADPQKAEEYACRVAREKKCRVTLVVSRRLSVWIDEQGTVYSRTEARNGQPNAPYSVVGGKAFRFRFGA